MRKLLILIAMINAYLLSSTPIDDVIAKEVGKFHLQIKNVNTKFTANEVVPIESNSSRILFIVTLQPHGFIAIAADTDIVPILSYSFQGNFNFQDSQKNLLLQLLKTDIELQKKAIETKTLLKDGNNQIWQHYINKNIGYFQEDDYIQFPAYSESKTGGWIQTCWLQSDPYNRFCPVDPISQKKCYVGCAGTSIAQLLNFHRFFSPVTFANSDSYTTDNNISIDADSERLDFLSFSRLNSYLDQIRTKFNQDQMLSDEEISALLFGAAISVNTHFYANETDSWTWNIAHSLRNTFGYKKAKSIYSENEFFFDQIDENIVNKKPVILILNTADEICLLCDGINSNNEYHLNLGCALNDNDAVSAWYHFYTEILPDYQVVSQAIVNIGDDVSRHLIANTKKIVLEEDEQLIDFGLEDDIDENERKDNAINKSIENALDENGMPKFGLTPKFVLYEDSPVPIKQVPPEYPSQAQKSGIYGDVILEVEVLDSGKVGAVEVVQSLMPGDGGLDEAAIQAVKQWEFSPAQSGGKPVACWVRFPISFELNN